MQEPSGCFASTANDDHESGKLEGKNTKEEAPSLHVCVTMSEDSRDSSETELSPSISMMSSMLSSSSSSLSSLRYANPSQKDQLLQDKLQSIQSLLEVRQGCDTNSNLQSAAKPQDLKPELMLEILQHIQASDAELKAPQWDRMEHLLTKKGGEMILAKVKISESPRSGITVSTHNDNSEEEIEMVDDVEEFVTEDEYTEETVVSDDSSSAMNPSSCEYPRKSRMVDSSFLLGHLSGDSSSEDGYSLAPEIHSCNSSTTLWDDQDAFYEEEVVECS